VPEDSRFSHLIWIILKPFPGRKPGAIQGYKGGSLKEDLSMTVLVSRFVGSVLAALTVSTAALAQSYYDDQACRQFADAQIAPIRDQANSQAIGSTLLGAGLGAAVGAAVGGGRGAGIGAASGAIVGTGVGAANAQNAAGYLQQQYNAYYAQCMASRRQSPPPYAAPAPAYSPTPGYAPSPGYAPQPGYPQPGSSNYR
jgi:hypothetical protein